MSWDGGARVTNMVGYFDGHRRRQGYRGAIDQDLAPWAQLLGRVTSRYDLAEYPQDELRLALGGFRRDHGRPADPRDPQDWEAVRVLLRDAGGWGHD